MNRIVSTLALIALAATACFAQIKKDETPKPAQSIAELKQQLEKILADTHTPGVSVAIVHRDGPEWVAGLGKSDVATNHATTDRLQGAVAGLIPRATPGRCRGVAFIHMSVTSMLEKAWAGCGPVWPARVARPGLEAGAR